MAKSSAWNRANPERLKANRKRAYHRNPEPIRAKASDYYSKNAEHVKAHQKKWRGENQAACRALSAKRRARKLKATPRWLSPEQLALIQEFYLISCTLSAHMGEPYHVDHIVLLKGRNVCGLHVPWNLQLLTGAENSRKKNRLPAELKNWIFHKD